MRRRAILGVIAIVLLALLTAGGALAVLARHVPAFYERAALPAGDERDAYAKAFYRRFNELFNKVGGDQPWEQQLTQQEFNGYFQGQDDKSDLPALIEIPDDVKEIRVALEDDLIRVGFRYGEGEWTCIVSVEFRAWLVANKPNTIALELCDFRAGALPLGTRSLIDYITEAARRQYVDVTWYHRGGHPVALLRLQANQARPTFQLRRLEVSPGKIVVASSPTREAGGPTSQPAAPRPPDPAAALPSQ
jgi:hypothetical protein